MQEAPNFRIDPLWLNIDKPLGFSSAKVVAIVKRVTGAKRVGHAGTLDPLASGCLPIAINKATKTCDYIVNDVKRYSFSITWGEFRATDDFEGEVEEVSEKRPKNEEIIAILPKFIGKIKQTPSRFSAIKIDGKRAYELARKKIDFKMKEREVKILSLKMTKNDKSSAEFEVKCTKGTYVRSLSRAICEELSVCGYVSCLKRLAVGKFLFNNSISLEKLKEIVNYGASFSDGSLLLLQDVLDISVIAIDDLNSSRFRNGQAIKLEPFGLNFTDNVVQVINQKKVIGLGKFEKDLLKPANVF